MNGGSGAGGVERDTRVGKWGAEELDDRANIGGSIPLPCSATPPRRFERRFSRRASSGSIKTCKVSSPEPVATKTEPVGCYIWQDVETCKVSSPEPVATKIKPVLHRQSDLLRPWPPRLNPCRNADPSPLHGKQVESANITFFHPNSDGGNDACSDSSVLGHSVKELQDSLLGAMHAVSLRNVLNVAGLSAFGVFVLYSVFLVMVAPLLAHFLAGFRLSLVPCPMSDST
jgi:hypothetical protein